MYSPVCTIPAPPPRPPVARSRSTSVRTLALIALACGVEASVHQGVAQIAANVEAGISGVRYDGFLGSAAASISPTIWWEHPRGRGLVSARARISDSRAAATVSTAPPTAPGSPRLHATGGVSSACRPDPA